MSLLKKFSRKNEDARVGNWTMTREKDKSITIRCPASPTIEECSHRVSTIQPIRLSSQRHLYWCRFAEKIKI
jgi:hypothetical protein